MKSTSAVLLALLTSAAFASPKPNVILIMTDDQGYGDFMFQLDHHLGQVR